MTDLTAVAAEAMGATSHHFAAALAGTPGATWMAATGAEQPGSAAYGVALLARYPARSWQVVRLPAIPFRFPMWLPGPGKVSIVSEEPRVAVSGRLDTPLGEITVVSTHLSFVPGWNVTQLRRLRRDLAPLPDPLVLMGDLNLTGQRPAALTGYAPLVRALTFPAEAPTRQLDHILLRGVLAPVRAAAAAALPLSDHRALTVDL
jgi:endonuclease/exonuclease/phosphatase family metal-dependent hydrolase